LLNLLVNKQVRWRG